MTPIKTITVNDVEISISSNKKQDDYICLTDMIKAKDGEFFITDWLRNRNTIEFLGEWETLYNPTFNYGEFAIIKSRVGLNSYKLSVKEWNDTTGAIGLTAKAGRYGGTYAHKDIAFQFGMWISPRFQLLLIKEYQRLKDAENNPLLGEWNVKRILSKTNYSIHTDAVKTFIIPKIDIEKNKPYAYANEADLLNIALWGCSAKEWRDANPDFANKNLNIRDVATINELIVLSNLESFNAELLKQGVEDKSIRYKYLHRMAQDQLKLLVKVNAEQNFKVIKNDKPKKLR